MIKITLEFPTVAQAHAVLGTIMAQSALTVVEPTEEVAPPKKKRRTKKAETTVADTLVVKDTVITPKPARKTKGGDPWGGTPELQTIRAELTKYSQKHGFKAARDILKEFEIKRIPELQERLYPEFLERLSQTPPPEEEEAS